MGTDDETVSAAKSTGDPGLADSLRSVRGVGEDRTGAGADAWPDDSDVEAGPDEDGTTADDDSE